MRLPSRFSLPPPSPPPPLPPPRPPLPPPPLPPRFCVSSSPNVSASCLRMSSMNFRPPLRGPSSVVSSSVSKKEAVGLYAIGFCVFGFTASLSNISSALTKSNSPAGSVETLTPTLLTPRLIMCASVPGWLRLDPRGGPAPLPPPPPRGPAPAPARGWHPTQPASAEVGLAGLRVLAQALVPVRVRVRVRAPGRRRAPPPSSRTRAGP